MQPLHFKVPRLKEETIKVECWDLDNFFEPIHFHEEFQITLVLEGEGSLFVAESVVPFKCGEIFLLGKNLPHVFRNKEYLFGKNKHKNAKAISVFFNQDVIKESLCDIPESYAIQRLLDLSVYGIRVSTDKLAIISEKLTLLPEKKSFERFIGLLDILESISNNNDLDFISSLGVPLHSVQENLPKINQVFEFVRTNFNEKIT